MPCWIRCFLATALLSACATLRTAPYGTDGWHELSSENFVLQTDLDEETARTLLRGLERFRAAMRRALGLKLQIPLRLTVIALAQRGALQHHGSRPHVEGFLRAEPFPLIALNAANVRNGTPLDELQLHELAHYFHNFMFARKPKWFSEGMAEYLATITLSEDGQKALVGRRHLGRMRSLKFPMEYEELWQWKGETRLALDTENQRYASSWLWVHFLFNSHSERFVAFMQQLAAGQEPRTAFERAFAGVSVETLNAQVRSYLRRDQRYKVYEYTLPMVASSFTTRMLSPSESLWVRAQVALDSDETLGILEEMARDRFPESTEALLIQALRISAERPLPQSLLTALRTHGADARAALILALHARHLSKDEHDSWTALALKLQPHHPQALQARLRYALAQSKQDELFPIIQQLVRIAPYSRTGLTLCVQGLVALRQCDEAAKVAEWALDVRHETSPDSLGKDQSQIRGLMSKCAQSPQSEPSPNSPSDRTGSHGK